MRQRRWAYLGVVSLLLAALVALRLRRRFRVVQIHDSSDKPMYSPQAAELLSECS